MKPLDFPHRWILITGASSGLGRQMARTLAKRYRANLVLVARREERLASLKAEVEEQYSVSVLTIKANLSEVSEAERVFEEAIEKCHLYGAILNAGITHFGDFDEQDWTALESLLAVNVMTQTRFARLLLPYLEQRKEHGGILLVSSMAGLTPVPYQTAYSASKAFIVNLGCGLHHEMWRRGVSVTTFVPGGIVTEMTDGQRFNGLRSWLMPVDKCADEAIEAFRSRRYLHSPGFVYRFGSVVTRFLPQRFIVGRVAEQYRKSLERHR
jgi:uncharacterized protein